MTGRQSTRFWVGVIATGFLGCADVGTTGTGGDAGSGGSGGTTATGGSGGEGGAGGIELCSPDAIDMGTVESASNLDMALVPSGDVFIIWREGAGEQSVWTNRWTRDGGWGAAERLSTPEAATSSPVIAVDGGGGVVAVWSESDCMGAQDIVSRRFTPGEGWGVAEPVESEMSYAQHPRVAVDALGNVIVVWSQFGESGAYDVWSNRWTPDTGWASAEPIGSSAEYIPDTDLATDSEGNVITLWRQRTEAPEYELWSNRWTDDDGWGIPVPLASEEPVGDYDLAFDSNGEAIAVWEAGNQFVSARWANTWEPAETIATSGGAVHPRIAFDREGNAVVAWEASSEVRTARRAPGQDWGATTKHRYFPRECDERNRCTSASSPEFAVDADGSVFLIWREYRIDGADIGWAKWTGTAGWTAPSLIETANWAAYPRVQFDGEGIAIGVWAGRAIQSVRFDDGCIADTTPYEESGGGGAGGNGGMDDILDDRCEGVVCPDTECRSGGVCNPDDGTCLYDDVAEDGVACSEGACLSGGCGRVGARVCDEGGLRAAIEEGSGPHFFACDEAVPVVLSEALIIDNDVILDGEGDLIIGTESAVINVDDQTTVEVRGVRFAGDGLKGSVWNYGNLSFADSRVTHFGNFGELALIDCEVVAPESYNGGVATLLRTRLVAVAEAPFYDEYRPAGVGIVNNGTMTLTDSTMTGPGDSDNGPTPLPYALHPIYNAYDATLIIERTTITDLYHYEVGAIDNHGTLDLIDSTVANNTAERGPSIWNSGTMNISNSTVSGANTAYGCGGYAHGYAIGNSGTLTVESSTIAANAVGSIQNLGTMSIGQTILDGDCTHARYVAATVDPATTSVGHNIVGGFDSCGFNATGDLINASSAELALGALGDNGGSTPTHSPLPGSVAIDAIPAPSCTIANDQRGEPRPAGGACDIGAVEVQLDAGLFR